MANELPKPDKKSNKIIGRRFRYASDYKVVPSLRRNGSYGKQVVYIGRWIRPTNSLEEYKRIVLWMRILTAVAAVAAVAAMWLHPAAMSHRWYVPVLVACLFPLAYQIMGAMTMPPEVSYMDRQQYDKSFVRCGHSAVFALVLICASALGCLIYWIIAAAGTVEGGAPYSLLDGVFAGLLILAGVTERVVYLFSRKITTDTYDNETYQP